MARKTLTDKGVQALKSRDKLYTHSDPQMPGHYVRVSPSGTKSFCVITRNPDGKQVFHTVGQFPILKIVEAREEAREAIKRIKVGKDRAGPKSFQAVADEWFGRHVEANGLRTASAIRRHLDKHIIPFWSGREFASIRRGDVTALLDHVEDHAGAVAADTVLAHLSRIFNWYSSRNDDYSSPLARGMRRSKPTDRARARILDDNELSEVWRVAAANGTFGAFIRVALLTAQRREKVATMKWADLSDDGEWRIPTGEREKGTAGSLILPEAALKIIKAQPRFASNPYVFAGRCDSHFSGYSKSKTQFDAKLPTMEQWTIHDLRRTARSLMSRAGVRPDVGERVLGHVQGGVLGIYDRHSYREEKAHALKALAALIESIINPTENVIALRK
jgi:integrase